MARLVAPSADRVLGPLAVIAVWLTLALGSAREAAGQADAQTYERNRSRLQQMTGEQRRQTWEKYQTFLSLPAEEQRRIRQLHAELRGLPSEKRERYQRLLDRYRKWKDDLPLYQRQRLEDTVQQGSAKLYEVFRDVQARHDEDERLRRYWLLPENPRIRSFVHTVLGKLTKEEIEALDQLPPRDRFAELMAHAAQHGVEPPPQLRIERPGARRQFLPGQLPPVDPEKLQAFLKSLPREQRAELEDQGRGKVKFERLLQRYYEQHPEELSERRRRGGESPGKTGKPGPAEPAGKSSERPPG